MIQIFFKDSKISEEDWNVAYKRIITITNSFPLQLQRLEGYNGRSPKLNKAHYNLCLEQNTEKEHISFWGDRMSFSARFTVKFYKNWDMQLKHGLEGEEIDKDMPITWYRHEINKNYGYPPKANGSYFDINPEGALYKYAIIAIGIMLENILPGRIFLIVRNGKLEIIKKLIKWLDVLFNEKFDIPIYFDKYRLLNSLIDYYDTKEELVARLDMIYMKPVLSNMSFAIEEIGYQPALNYYSEVLSNTTFATFGFYDVLNPWMSVTKDLESTLDIISKSKKLLLLDHDDEYKQKDTQNYKIEYILKELLNEYILWSPEQREKLELLYTNKQALETGEEDIFGTMRRMMGYRVDICPVYASEKQLFEAFMYHDPKKGTEYKKIIEKWKEDNKNSYNKLIKTQNKVENIIEENVDIEIINKQEEEKEKELQEFNNRINNFVKQYNEHEQFLISEAVKLNPVFMDFDNTLNDFIEKVKELSKNKKYIEYNKSLNQEELVQDIKSWIKKKELSINTNFEQWIEQETDKNILDILLLITSLGINTKALRFVREEILFNKKLWELF